MHGGMAGIKRMKAWGRSEMLWDGGRCAFCIKNLKPTLTSVPIDSMLLPLQTWVVNVVVEKLMVRCYNLIFFLFLSCFHGRKGEGLAPTWHPSTAFVYSDVAACVTHLLGEKNDDILAWWWLGEREMWGRERNQVMCDEVRNEDTGLWQKFGRDYWLVKGLGESNKEAGYCGSGSCRLWKFATQQKGLEGTVERDNATGVGSLSLSTWSVLNSKSSIWWWLWWQVPVQKCKMTNMVEH